ncbi:MAG: hypothetical protein H6R40_374 [Gemmatimonadetes bacterium]|nr:hypothetical protein [Gemmatimonadota bacterium]
MPQGPRGPGLFQAGEGSPPDGALSVSQVVGALKRAVDGAMGQVWIKGELTELKIHSAGHWYFSLRDADAQIRCVIWKSNAQRLRTRPTDGTEVFILARPDFWAERGDVRLSAVQLLPTAALGDQELQLQRTREALARDGLFDPARKRPLPRFPRRVAIVTSLEGAALHDFVTVARGRWPAHLLIVGSKVQGDQAGRELVRALALVNRLRADVCVVGRGGGSREDLAVFNLEPVCRAIAATTVPVVAAVGHQTDVTLADLVADHRAATPSAAMELILPERREVLERMNALGARMAGGLRRRTRVIEERLFRAEDRLEGAIGGRIRHDQEQLGVLGAQLEALSPLRVLGRGYAVATGPGGGVLRRKMDFVPGAGFTLRVVDGEVPAWVEEP